MQEQSKYTVKSKDTFVSIAKQIGLKDPMKLKEYHNERADFNSQVGNQLHPNITLLMPSSEEVRELNAEKPFEDEVKQEQREEEQKQQEEKEKEATAEQQKQEEKSEHDDKYYVVNGAKCICNKAENPNQQATLQVTSHKTIVFNEQSDKYVATEDDKTFIPAVMTFGKCTLKPSSSGNLPCSPQCAPKWSKTYEGTKVLGKNTLTEISELQCMVGGKITIAKHGQTDRVLLQHSENTTPLEVNAVNPAIEMPKTEKATPKVKSITLNEISGRTTFSPKKSSERVPTVYLRKGEKASFYASVEKGNEDLVSWMIYKGFSKEKKDELLEKQEIGVHFTQSFQEYGKYRVEGFGTLKKNLKKYNSFDDCSIHIQVIENTITSVKCLQEGETAEKEAENNWAFKKGTSLTFKANFYIEPTEEELSSLKMTILDERGSILNEFSQKGDSITFVPENKGTIYTILVEYTTPSGKKIQEKLKGKCALNSVISICPTNNASKIRPNEEITINVTKMKFSDNSEDIANIKWALNGIVVQEGGKTYKFRNDKEEKYLVEAFSLKSNSLSNSDEKDTWKLTITENEVEDISIEGFTKVGKSLTLRAKTTFPDLTYKDLERIEWTIPFSYIDENGIEHKPFEKHFQIKGMGLGSLKDPRTMKITPLTEGEFEVICRINKKIATKKIKIVRPTISSPHWIDKDGSSGNILTTAGYDQEMYAYVEHLGLDGEEVIVEVYDAKDKQKPIFISEKITVPVGSKEFTFYHSIEKMFEGKTEEEKKKEDKERKDFQIFFKIKPVDTKFIIASSKEEFENNLLTITNKGNIVDAYFCDAKDLNKVSIAVCGYKLYFKIYATNLLKREVEIYFCTKKASKYDFSNSFVWRNWKDLEKKFKEERFFDVKKGIIDKKGELLVEVDTTKLKGIAPIDAIAIVKIINKNGNELGAYKDLNNTLKLYNKSVLIGLPENSSPVKAGYFKIDKIKKVQLEEEKQGHSCPRCTAPVTVAQLRELFPDVKEYTLKTVADTYTKYMKELQMDTCWNKAHFFAQAAIETGFKLHIKKGENMDYESEERLHNVFLSRFFEGEWVKDKSSGKKKFVPLVDSNAEFHDEKNRVFKSKELSQKAKQLINSKPKDQNIANFVYANINGNKNEASGDGWRFRGSGLIQLTGRGNFKMVNDKIEKLWGQSILTDSGADQVRENPELAVLTAMGYFAAKGINRIANGASSDQQIKEVCLKVGDDVDIKINNRKTKNHEEKKRFFKDKSSKTFKTNECTLNSELKIKEGIEWLLSKAITQEDVLKGVHYKVPYANDSNRTHPEGENTMDCSELVCRFLYQIEWCSVGWSGNTFILYDFAEKYSEYLTKHDDISYKPEKGDIFLWRNTNGMGHTGIVIDYDENTDVVTTIESISSKETPEGINKEIVMDGVTQLKWKRLSRHLLSHPNTNGKSTCRFYTPKEHFSKVDKKIIWKGKYVEFKIIIK